MPHALTSVSISCEAASQLLMFQDMDELPRQENRWPTGYNDVPMGNLCVPKPIIALVSNTSQVLFHLELMRSLRFGSCLGTYGFLLQIPRISTSPSKSSHKSSVHYA